MRKETKVAIIDNSINPSVYNPIRHWAACLNTRWETFEAKNSCFPRLNKDFTHIILTGSEASILERSRWVEEEAELVSEAVEKGIPILGSCYGHQLLALALGGPSNLKRSEHPEVGWISVRIIENDDLLGRPGKVFTFSSHFDEVVDLGEDFDILASSQYCQIQAFRLRNKPIWGLQIHPEMSIKEATIYIKNSISLDLPTKSYYKKALEQTPKDSGLISQIVERFLASSSSL